MSELPHEVVWFTAAVALTLADRVLGTGYVLTAIGVACLGGVTAAAFSDLGFAFESAVTIGIAGPLIYSAALRYGVRKTTRENGKRERNVKAMVGALGRFAPKLDSVVSIIASIVLILCTVVAVTADAKPANEIFSGIAAACGVLVSGIASRLKATAFVVGLMGFVGFVIGGLAFTALIAILRLYMYGPD